MAAVIFCLGSGDRRNNYPRLANVDSRPVLLLADDRGIDVERASAVAMSPNCAAQVAACADVGPGVRLLWEPEEAG
ncbi:hypothetical protein GCM10022222_71050 [Amycolatopsis ultiminotia]|uniref:Uncharacterized protein n=1 Tax=Amycolatopsis ultiminotia TaxID=543629 RepID=A0ABP6Y2D3_9PSEU